MFPNTLDKGGHLRWFNKKIYRARECDVLTQTNLEIKLRQNRSYHRRQLKIYTGEGLRTPILNKGTK